MTRRARPQMHSCHACGRSLSAEEAVIGYGGIACITCEEWVSGTCSECGGDLARVVTEGPCRCARDERALASALAARGLSAEVEELGGGLIGVNVRMGRDRYALITRHEGPWILGPYTADNLNKELLRGHEAPCPEVLADGVAGWALAILAEWAAS